MKGQRQKRKSTSPDAQEPGFSGPIHYGCIFVGADPMPITLGGGTSASTTAPLANYSFRPWNARMAEAARAEGEKIKPVAFGFDSGEFDFRGQHGSTTRSRSATGLQEIAVWPVMVLAEGYATAASIARQANVPAISAFDWGTFFSGLGQFSSLDLLRTSRGPGGQHFLGHWRLMVRTQPGSSLRVGEL